jgi:N-acetylglucosaminyldiphosphoundecaprenol N-acetyl-beta-D-mannosaminyltransferase
MNQEPAEALINGPTCQLFGVPIHALSMEQVLSAADAAIRTRRRLLIGVVNAAKIVNMHREGSLRQSVLTADMILADGMPVVWASRLFGRPLPERVPGIDLMQRLLDRGRTRQYRVYCLGATQEVLSAATARMQQEYPGIVFVGQQHGYFKTIEEPQIAERIRAARPDILFVAMSSPKKEEFLARWAEHIDVPVCHGVGGSFDVLAGKVRRAPLLWQRLGMEWFYRVLQEPRRMWRRYLVTNTLFCTMVLSELVGRSHPSRD